MTKNAIISKAVWGRVRRAMVKGSIPFPTSLKCADCGEKAYCYDHRNYLDIFNLSPVCRRCNAKRGPGEL